MRNCRQESDFYLILDPLIKLIWFDKSGTRAQRVDWYLVGEVSVLGALRVFTLKPTCPLGLYQYITPCVVMSLIPGVHFTNELIVRNLKQIRVVRTGKNNLIGWPFCTCHGSQAVVACAKLWPGWVAWIKKPKSRPKNYHKISVLSSLLLLKWAPDLAWHFW